MHIPDVLLLSLVGLLGLLCQWLAWRAKLPAILFLLILGILLGPVSGVLQPDELFGDLLFPFVSLSVAIILFEGSLTLKRSELSEIGDVVRNLVSYGALLNAVIVAVATHFLTGISWPLSALFGAIMVVTGPTVIMPMLRTVKPNALIAKTLRWEGIVIDPLGALFAVLVFEWIVAQQASANLASVFFLFGQAVLTGALIGVVVGYLFGLLLRHRFLPEYLHNFAAIAFVTSAFALSNTLIHESGLLAVTVMGIWMANMSGVHTREILNFKENLTLVLVSSLFIILSARMDFGALFSLGWAALGVLLVMQFVARPAKVFLSTFGSSFTRNERLLLAWVGPRGIVAAAISAVFALKLEQLQIPDAELLVPLAFSVIIGTVVIQSATARLFTNLLGVNAPDTQGFLIIGANPVAVEIGKALKKLEIDAILCDTDWQDVSAARMAGLKTYYGNILSEHADLHLDITSLGGMVGLSRNHAVNSTAAIRFREDFGTRKLFVLPTALENRPHYKHGSSELYAGRVLFDAKCTYHKLYNWVYQYKAEIKSTAISEEYPYSRWLEDNDPSVAIPVFAMNRKDELLWFTEGGDLQPEAGWKVYALAKPSAREDTSVETLANAGKVAGG